MARAKDSSRASDDAETVSSYFRKVFAESPKLLKSRSNDALLQRWLDDHPGETEVPKRVRQSMANIKSLLRRRGRKRRQHTEQPQAAAAVSAPAKRATRGLEHLEEQIDDCLTAAKHLDRE